MFILSKRLDIFFHADLSGLSADRSSSRAFLVSIWSISHYSSLLDELSLHFCKLCQACSGLCVGISDDFWFSINHFCSLMNIISTQFQAATSSLRASRMQKMWIICCSGTVRLVLSSLFVFVWWNLCPITLRTAIRDERCVSPFLQNVEAWCSAVRSVP